LIEDTLYNVISVHDFPIIPNQHWSATYVSYKEKLTHRIDRFFERIISSQSILFIRWAATYEQAVELQSTLEGIVKGQFNILILCPEEGFKGVSEIDWGLDKVCAVKVPRIPNDPETWNYVLEGITLTPRKQLYPSIYIVSYLPVLFRDNDIRFLSCPLPSVTSLNLLIPFLSTQVTRSLPSSASYR